MKFFFFGGGELRHLSSLKIEEEEKSGQLGW